jgi:type III pantothenate kinase
MDRRLAVDIGNTRIKIAVFSGKNLIHSGFVERLTVPALEKIIDEQQVTYVIISSVRHLTRRMVRFIEKNDRVYLLSVIMALPFSIEYTTPQTLGLDRLASVAGAWSLFPDQNSMVIDAGTCIKYEIITKQGIYKGGNIAPGLHMRLKAMHLLTSKLPHVPPYERYEAIGTDTVTALQVGACTGAIHEMEGFIADYKKIFGKLNILLTGGDRLFFVNKLKTEIFEAPNLVLQGLIEILDYNVQQQR